MSDGKIEGKQKKRPIKTIGAIIFFVLAAVMILMFVVGLCFAPNYRIENLTEVEGRVESVSVYDRSSELTVKLEGDDAVYSVSSLYFQYDGLKTIESDLVAGTQVKFTVLKNEKESDGILSVSVMGIEADGVTLLFPERGLEITRSNNTAMLIVSGVMTAIFVLLAVLLLVRRPHRQRNASTFVETYASRQTFKMSKIRKRFLTVLIPINMVLIGVTLSLVCYSLGVETSWVRILSSIFLAVACVNSITTYAVGFWVRKKEMEEIARSFDFDLSRMYDNTPNRFEDAANLLTFSFEEEGLTALYWRSRVSSGDGEEGSSDWFDFDDSDKPEEQKLKLVLGFDELHFAAKDYYRPMGRMMSIYLVVTPNELREPLRRDLFFTLDQNLFYWIKRYGIQVEGLDELLADPLGRMRKNCKYKYYRRK